MRVEEVTTSEAFVLTRTEPGKSSLAEVIVVLFDTVSSVARSNGSPLYRAGYSKVEEGLKAQQRTETWT